MSPVQPALFFLSVPDLRALCSVTLTLSDDYEEPRTKQISTCRELVLLFLDVLAAPALDSFTEITAVMASPFYHRGVLQSFAQRHCLQVSRPEQVYPGTLQCCVSFSVTSRLSPNWNKAGLYLIQGRDFLSNRGRLTAVSLESSFADGKLCLSLLPSAVRLPPNTLQDLDLPPPLLKRFCSDPDSVLDPRATGGAVWCHVLPSMKMGQIVGISRKLPRDGPFRSYRDLQSHWNRLYGYELPDQPEEQAVYCSVYFKPVGPRLFTYPLCCIRLSPVQRCPRVDLEGALSCFMDNVRETLPSVCGFPTKISTKSAFTTTALIPASRQISDQDLNLTELCSSTALLTQLPPPPPPAPHPIESLFRSQPSSGPPPVGPSPIESLFGLKPSPVPPPPIPSPIESLFRSQPSPGPPPPAPRPIEFLFRSQPSPGPPPPAPSPIESLFSSQPSLGPPPVDPSPIESLFGLQPCPVSPPPVPRPIESLFRPGPSPSPPPVDPSPIESLFRSQPSPGPPPPAPSPIESLFRSQPSSGPPPVCPSLIESLFRSQPSPGPPPPAPSPIESLFGSWPSPSPPLSFRSVSLSSSFSPKFSDFFKPASSPNTFFTVFESRPTPPSPPPTPIPLEKPKFVPIFRTKQPSQLINVAQLKDQKERAERITLPLVSRSQTSSRGAVFLQKVPLGGQTSATMRHIPRFLPKTKQAVILIPEELERKKTKQAVILIPEEQEKKKTKQAVILIPVEQERKKTKQAVILIPEEQERKKTKTVVKFNLEETEASKPKGNSKKGVLKKSAPKEVTEETQAQTSQREDKTKDSRDVETMARNNQLFRVSSSKMLRFLRARGENIEHKLPKDQLMLKVKACLAES